MSATSVARAGKRGNICVGNNRTLSHNAETKDFARPTSHPVRGWTGKNKAFCSPGTQNGRRVIKVYVSATMRPRLPVP